MLNKGGVKMNLIKCKPKQVDPFTQFDVFDLDHPFWGVSLFPGFKSGESAWPSIDVSEDKVNTIVKADIPGLKKEDITLKVEGSVLTIQGERKTETEEKDKNYHRVERSYGRFERSVDLHLPIDQTKVKANYKNGVLEVIVPKIEKATASNIVIEEK